MFAGFARIHAAADTGTPFSLNIVALAMYLRFVHAVSYKRLSRRLLLLRAVVLARRHRDLAESTRRQ